MKPKPKIGIALGGGAARGYAHIGVLQVLEEIGVKPDVVAGTSIGSLIGSLYCVGLSPKMICKLAVSLTQDKWIDFVVPRKGLIAGRKIEDILRLLTKNTDFKDLKIPLAVTATDLKTGSCIIINEGNVARAVRASISIPGIFTPVITGNMILVDGGVLNRIPVDVVRQMSADIVIAVDLGHQKRHRLNNIYDILFQTFDVMGEELQKYKAFNAELVIKPDLEDIMPLNFNCAKDCIERGRMAAIKHEKEIRTLLHIGDNDV